MSRGPLTIGECCAGGERPLASRRRGEQRRRAARRALAALLLLTAVAGIAGWLLTAPIFEIQRVEAGPFRFSEKAQLDRILDSALGENLWSFASDSLRTRLLSLAWVQDAHIVRKLPSTLKIELRERRPLLIVAGRGREKAENQPLVLLSDGRIMRFPAGLPVPALPVLLGATLAKSETPDVWRLPERQAAAVMALADGIARSGLEAVCPVDFVVIGKEGLAIDLARDGRRLLLGWRDFTERLRLYLAAAEQVSAGGGIVDLRFRNRISVTDKA